MSEPRWVFRHRLQVRFSDCDLLGHVNHAVYLTYFEQARSAWWRALGGGTASMPGAGAIIVHASCNYRAPAFPADDLEIRIALASLGTSSVTLDYAIVNATTGLHLADGRTVNVAYDYTVNRTVPLPDMTRALLSAAPEPD